VVSIVTFSCYGSHLPGDSRGSFDHVRRGERRLVFPSAGLEQDRRQRMRQPPYLLSTPHCRALVRDAIVMVCEFRTWFLYALHVRTNHVHGVVESDLPRQVLSDWKAYATRSLRQNGPAGPEQPVWTHGGSTRRIASADAVKRAIRYVLEGQGEPMEMYSAEPRPDGRGFTG
jgi:REP element-mobilizing transposase RayT